MNGTRLLTFAASVTVVLAIAVGLYLSGSPAEQRLLRLDERRVSDLLQLSYAINRYREQATALPGDLAVLVDGQRLRSVPTDPESGAAYTYEIIDANSYRLCAVFARPSVKTATQDFWAHPSGQHCFALNVGAGR